MNRIPGNMFTWTSSFDDEYGLRKRGVTHIGICEASDLTDYDLCDDITVVSHKTGEERAFRRFQTVRFGEEVHGWLFCDQTGKVVIEILND